MIESREAFFSNLIDDYYAECDEHLATVRRALLAMEAALSEGRFDRRSLDDLFRCFHTIKGLSGMVGLREAEQLAHQIETFLRSLSDNLVPLTPERVDLLLDSARLLEQVIAAHRLKEPVPDPAPITAKLAQNTLEANPPDEVVDPRAPAALKRMLHAERLARLGEAVAKGARLWLFEFMPDLSLAEKGITVNAIRALLLEMGEIISVLPELTADQGIKFIFIVSSFRDESSFAVFPEEGVTYRPYALHEETQEENEEAAETALSLPRVRAGENIDAGGTVPASRSLTPAHIVRVDVARLDRLVEILSSLVISRSHLQHNLQHIEPMMPSRYWRPVQDAGTAMDRHLRELREGIMSLRMVPIRNVFEHMRFAVHELCREQRKRVIVRTRGEETEIDKNIVEQLVNPLLHLVRNAVGHGIEPEAERISASKPPEGTMKLSASAAGGCVTIEIEDDGRGIDPDLILRKVGSRELIAPVENPAALLDILCEAGFTTLAEADITSGRGLGMTIVKKIVAEMGGTIALDTRVGEGSRFTIRLPMTLAVLNAAIVAVGGRTFALPASSVQEFVRVGPEDVMVFEKNEAIKYREGMLPLVRLAALFGLKEEYTRTFYAVVVGYNSKAAALAVERLIGQREVVVRALADPLLQVPGVSGATELGDGRPVLILDPTALLHARQPGGRTAQPCTAALEARSKR